MGRQSGATGCCDGSGQGYGLGVGGFRLAVGVNLKEIQRRDAETQSNAEKKKI